MTNEKNLCQVFCFLMLAVIERQKSGLGSPKHVLVAPIK